MAISSKQIRQITKRIKSHSRFTSISSLLDDSSTVLDFDSLKKEMATMHSARKIHKLSVSSANFGKNLVKASTIETMNRARLVEIKIAASDIEMRLSDHIKYFSKWATIKFAEDLKAFSTIKDRSVFLEDLTVEMRKYLSSLTNLIALVNFYIEDIDKASYALRNMAQIYEVIRKNEGATQL